jgi:hypothetical protein
MKNRIYVAFSYPRGVASNSCGERFGNYHTFASAAERNNFVASGSDFRTENDWREAISSRDAEWRRLQRSISHHISRYGATWEAKEAKEKEANPELFGEGESRFVLYASTLYRDGKKFRSFFRGSDAKRYLRALKAVEVGPYNSEKAKGPCVAYIGSFETLTVKN